MIVPLPDVWCCDCEGETSVSELVACVPESGATVCETAEVRLYALVSEVRACSQANPIPTSKS